MAQTFTEIDGAFPFNAFALAPDSQISAADLNHPITDADRITVSEDGHLMANGKRLRIFGTNLSEFPKTHKDAEFAAQALANQGYNCIRFHHTDADWTNCFIKNSNGKRVLNKEGLEAFDYFFAQLKKNGIYSNINLLTGRTYTINDGLDSEINSVKDWKNRHSLGFWNEDGKNVQKKWADTLLSHVNPYTGLSYLEDPAVAIVEINNENGLLQAYLGGGLEEYNGKYWQDLEDQWNNWLKKEGLSYEILNKRFNSNTKISESLISNTSRWNLENHNGAKAKAEVTDKQTAITVEKNGEAGWHVQYNCSRLNMEESKIYTINLEAKASEPKEVDLSLMQAHDPWKQAGFSKKLKLTDQWQSFTYTISGVTTDNNLRLNIGNLGLSAGTTFYFRNITLMEGGNLIQVQEGTKSKAGNKTVKMPHQPDYSGMPLELKKLVTKFLWETEAAYWQDMCSYVRNTLGSKSLLMGTIDGCSTNYLQACFDIIDSHAYWNHPVFPGKSWDMSNYYVQSRSLTKSLDDNTLLNCAKYRVYGKPFSCSEYDHPYPNQFHAEMYPMLASYASFQDWDVLFTFCYTLPKTKGGQNERITGYFDQGLTPLKSCAAPIAARIFRNFMVAPGKTAVYVPVSLQNEKDNLYKFHSWSIGDTSIYGMNKSFGLNHRIGVVLTDDISGKKIPANAQLLTKEISELSGRPKKIFNDTKEIYWDLDSGVYIVCNDNVMITVSNKNGLLPEYPAEWLKNKRLLPLSNNQDLAVISAVKKNSDYAGFAASWNGNKGEALAQYGGAKGNPGKLVTCKDNINLTTLPSLGSGPAQVLGIDGKLSCSNNATAIFHYADLTGNPKGKGITGTEFQFTPDCGSLWFTVKIK